MDPITIGVIVVAALSGVASTLGGIATRKLWKRVTKTEASADTLHQRLNFIDPAGPNKFTPQHHKPFPHQQSYPEPPGRKPGESHQSL
jgi:hypothetical protein